jgi:hypothetical protein
MMQKSGKKSPMRGDWQGGHQVSNAFWNLCPVSARHGYLLVVKNEQGGLIAVCPNCYVPAKGRKNLLDVK